jgi:hypothetical protein
MPNKLLILSMIFLLFGGCDGVGEDWLGTSVPAFASQRDDLYEAKKLIQTLAATEGISAFHPGALYDESPDRVRHVSETPIPLELLDKTSLKDPQSKVTLEQLRAVARKLSCAAVTVDEVNTVRVIMFYGRNSEYGYVSFDPNEGQTPRDGVYLEIPGEKKWYAFRR